MSRRVSGAGPRAALVLALAGWAGGAGAAIFHYEDFNSTAGLTLSGSAAQAGDEIRLTPASANQSGAVWYNTPDGPLKDLYTRIHFRITEPGGIADEGGDPGGNGLSFRFSGIGPGAPVSTDHFTIVIDTFDNGPDDESGNTMQVFRDGIEIRESELIQRFPGGINLSDGNIHTLEVKLFEFGGLQVYVDGRSIALLIGFPPISDVTAPAFVGIESSTGGAFENHDLIFWYYESTPIPEPGSLGLLGGCALLGLRRKR